VLVLAAVAAVIAGWLGFDPAKQRYHLWKQERALSQARAFIDNHDAADAQLALDVAFAAAPGRIDAWRVAADMLEQVGAQQSVRLRQHIVAMESATLDDKVALINGAIKFHDLNSAHDALTMLTPEEAAKPPALAAALSFALWTENSPVADLLFDRLKAAFPDNDDFRVAQAILRLKNPKPDQMDAARAILQGFAGNPKYSLRIHRELMTDAIVHRDLASARKWSALVAADPQSDFNDRLHEANFDLLVDKRPPAEVYGDLESRASSNPAAAADLIHWFLAQGKGAEADRWLAGLPLSLQSDGSIRAAQAEVFAQLKDWDRLDPMLEAGAWGPVSKDSIRLAMAARLVGSRGSPDLQHQVWDEALQATEGRLSGMIVLEQLAVIWRFDAESDRTLWTIARAFPDQVWVQQTLLNAYRARGDAANMREVMAILRDSNPAVPRYKNDWAVLTLLTEPTSDWDDPKQTLEDLYQGDKSNPFYATGYAFALAQAGRAPEALAVVSKISQLERDYSPRAPYLAYIYALNKQRDEVDRLENLSRGTSFLKEEETLFIEAHTELDRKPAPVLPSTGMKPPPEP
jgi:hypothetical protein